jgi:hypothetical protein
VGLSGKKRVWFRGIFHLIGILGESPFVSKLRKAKSAQHSVHPTGGSLRVFRQFAWLEASPGKVALSPPAHPRVTHPVGRINQHLDFMEEIWIGQQS